METSTFVAHINLLALQQGNWKWKSFSLYNSSALRNESFPPATFCRLSMTKLHRLIIVAHHWKENQLSRQSGLAAFGAWRFGEIPTIWLLSPESSKQTKMCCRRCMAACTVHINCNSCILALFVILVRQMVERKVFWDCRTITFPIVCKLHFWNTRRKMQSWI